MILEHPLYGEMVVPDSKEELQNELRIVKEIQERYEPGVEAWHPIVQAYKDMLELALDLTRREDDEDAI